MTVIVSIVSRSTVWYSESSAESALKVKPLKLAVEMASAAPATEVVVEAELARAVAFADEIDRLAGRCAENGEGIGCGALAIPRHVAADGRGVGSDEQESEEQAGSHDVLHDDLSIPRRLAASA